MALSRWKDRWRFLILAGEPKVLLLSLLGFLVGIGFAWGISSSNALLISRTGVQSLFYVYFGSSLLTFGMAGVFYFLADRYPQDRIFCWSFEILAAGILIFWWILKANPSSHFPFYAARAFFFAVFIVTNLEFWMVAGRYFTNLESKLRYPLLVAANVVGIMTGGLLLDRFATQYGVVNFFLAWSVVLILSPWLLLPLKKNPHPIARESHPTSKKIPPPPGTGRLMTSLLLFWLAYTYLGYGVDFFFNKAALQNIGDENLLAAYFGKVGFYSLLLVCLYQLCVAKYLSSRLSVDRSVMLIALLFFLAIVSLPFSSSLSTVTFSEGLLYYFIDFAAVALLMPVVHVFPEAIKGKVLIGIEGFGRPLGNLLLLALALGLAWKGQFSSLTYFLLGGALLFLIYPFVFRCTYFRYLLECLKSTDQALLVNAIQALGEPDKKRAAPPLLTLMENTQDVAIQREIILALGRIRSPEALPRIIAMFSVPNESLQMAVIESLALYKNYASLFALYGVLRSQENVSFQVRCHATLLMTRLLGKKMLFLLKQALAEEDLRIKANAIESIALVRDKQMVPWLLPYLSNENRRIQTNAAIALYPYRQTRAEALAVVQELFSSKDPLGRFSGIYAIGELSLVAYKLPLIALLQNSEPRLQQHIITALAKMRLPEYCEKFVDLVLGTDEGVALESIRNLSRFPESSRWMVFEKISRLPPEEIKKLLTRFDQTPLDFSKERMLLVSRSSLPGPRPI